MKKPIDWKALKLDWAHQTDSAIAAKLRVNRQNVSMARKRLGAPPSPAGHGGARYGGVTRGTSIASKLRATCNKLGSAQRAELLTIAEQMLGRES